MLHFVAAGVAAGGVSYFIGLPLAYATFLAIAIVAVAVGVTSALTVKVPPTEPKARKLKTEKRHGSAAASSSLSASDTAADTSETDKAEDRTEPKALSKRDKERAKKAAKKEADEKQKQAEVERAAAEEKQKQAAARAAKEAAAAAAKAAEAAEKERLAALEAVEEDEGDEAPAKKNKKKKKKKTEEKKGNDSVPTPTAKSSESKNSAPTPTAKNAPTPTAKKGEPADSKKSKDSSAKAEAASSKVDVSKQVEAASKNVASQKFEPVVDPDEKVDAKEPATQDSSMAWEVKTGKKKRGGAPEPAAVPLTPTTAVSSSSDQKVEISIDPKNYGVIIGKLGSTLKLITDATQTNIEFSKKEEGRVTVSGPSRENIDKAITAMNQLAAKGYSDLTHGRRDEGSIVVPSNKRFNIIGTKGETVRLIQDRLKVKVNMPDRDTNDSTVTVLGENADVQEALRCISDLMTKGYSEITHPGWVSEVVEVPSGQLGNIIGAQGATVRQIQDTTGAKINIEGSTVTVLGQQTQVAEAKNKITQLLTPAEPLPADPEWSQGASAPYVDLW